MEQGFFFHINLEGSSKIELILTNKHAVKDCKSLSFYLHEAESDDERLYPTGKSLSINIEDYSSIWIPHPDPDVDLGALLFVPIAEQIKAGLNKEVFRIPLDEALIKTDQALLNTTSVGDEVLMVGYPNGLWDEINNFPILRKGIAATPPGLDFQNEESNIRGKVGIVDIASFPGSSGSPILICMQGSFPDKAGNLNVGNKVILLGLLSSGPIYTSEEKIQIKAIPTQLVPVTQYNQMLHLGIYVKAKTILELSFLIKEKHELRKNALSKIVYTV